MECDANEVHERLLPARGAHGCRRETYVRRHATAFRLTDSIARSAMVMSDEESSEANWPPMFGSSRNYSFISSLTTLSRAAHAISIVVGHDTLKRTWLTSLASLRTKNKAP